MNRLLTQKEVCALVRITYPTLCRWLNTETFPQPVNGRKRKLLWTEQSISEWMNRQVSQIITPSITYSKEQRQQDRARQRNVELARQALERHAAGRKKR